MRHSHECELFEVKSQPEVESRANTRQPIGLRDALQLACHACSALAYPSEVVPLHDLAIAFSTVLSPFDIMPRDLGEIAKEDTAEGLPPLTKSSPNEGFAMDQDEEEQMLEALSQKHSKRDSLHPYTQTLNLSDIESCVRLEDETFPPHERCTRQKVS